MTEDEQAVRDVPNKGADQRGCGRGTTHFQPKLRPATSGCYLTCGNALSASFPARLGRHRAVRCRTKGRREDRLDVPQRRLVIVRHEMPVDVGRERGAVVAKPCLDALDVHPVAQQQRGGLWALSRLVEVEAASLI